jgi:hypothetical protein
MVSSILLVPCPGWAIPGSSNLPQQDPGQETSCARPGGGWGKDSMTAAISWRPQSGTKWIQAWLHTTRMPLLGPDAPFSVSVLPQTSARSVPPFTALVQAESAWLCPPPCMGRRVISEGFTGPEAAPASLLLPACPPGCLPQPHMH